MVLITSESSNSSDEEIVVEHRQRVIRDLNTIEFEQSGSEQIDVTEGFLEVDAQATTPCQREATSRLGMTLQLEQEALLSQNPKIRCMLETYFSMMVTSGKTRENLKDAAAKIVELCDDIDRHPDCCLHCNSEKPIFTYEDISLQGDLLKIYKKHYPPPPMVATTSALPTPNTLSSSFISIITSETTLPTPEPVPTPEPTLSEVMLQVVVNVLDKACFAKVNEAKLNYDTAYVELTKAVEQAMEIPVIQIREDIADLLFCAYRMFELNILEKERIAAEIAWEKRMRKKYKRTLRRLHNFKGYETPPTPKSEVSSHESYKVPPHRPCVCHPQWHYNRYAKDRFGIYLPRKEAFSKDSITAPLVFEEEEQDSKSGNSEPSPSG